MQRRHRSRGTSTGFYGGGQLFGGFTLASGYLNAGLLEVPHGLWVGQDRYRFLECFKIFGGNQDRRRLPVDGDGDSLVLGAHSVHELGEVCLYPGHWHDRVHRPKV